MTVTVYASLEALKARLGLSATDSRDDEALEGIIEAVSRAIDLETGTRFYAAEETRWFTAPCGNELLVDDLLSVSANGLKTDLAQDGTYGTTWATADFLLAPYNAALEGRPYWKIELGSYGAYTFPIGVRRGVQVTGRWGFSETVPKIVETVCLRESLYRFQASRTPYGMTTGDGSVAIPPTMRLSQNSRFELAPFKRVVMA